jgi:hypothetical protein
MGRPPKYSRQQREAVIRAMLEGGMSSGEACAAAAAGELGVGGFEIAESTACELTAKARREAASAADPPSGNGDIGDRARAAAEATIARVEKLGEQATAKDLAALRAAMAVVQDADQRKAKQAARDRASRPRQTEEVSDLRWARAWLKYRESDRFSESERQQGELADEIASLRAAIAELEAAGVEWQVDLARKR